MQAKGWDAVMAPVGVSVLEWM
eukprot:COSAG02_NODE_53861_length_299_cov_0.780000_2_plen_21_part_01